MGFLGVGLWRRLRERIDPIAGHQNLVGGKRHFGAHRFLNRASPDNSGGLASSLFSKVASPAAILKGGAQPCFRSR